MKVQYRWRTNKIALNYLLVFEKQHKDTIILEKPSCINTTNSMNHSTKSKTSIESLQWISIGPKRLTTKLKSNKSAKLLKDWAHI